MNQILNKSSSQMVELENDSVDLVVTSPPYNVGKEYEQDQSQDDWLQLMRHVLSEVYRVVVPGGRVCVNVANIGRKPYRPLHMQISQICFDQGLIMRGEIIWHKGASAGTSTAWGSWCSATNPVIRDIHEYILVFSKSTMRRERKGLGTVSQSVFLESTKSVWSFPTESSQRVGHPAPFPLELPKRLIQLYSFKGDLVLDPFCGSGTTCLAALQLGRSYVGYDVVPDYCELARKRILASHTVI